MKWIRKTQIITSLSSSLYVMFHLLLSSLLVLEHAFVSHLSHLGYVLHSAELLNNFGYVQYGIASGFDKMDAVRVANGDRLTGMCASSLSNHSLSSTTSMMTSLFDTYISLDGNQPLAYWPTRPLAEASCVLVDESKQIMWLISDTLGSTPLWYSLDSMPNTEVTTKNIFIVTSDFIGARRLGFKHLTPLGPGQLLAIDTANLDILGMSQWQSDVLRFTQVSKSFVRNLPETYSKRLFAKSLDVVYNTHKTLMKNTHRNNIVIELDTTDSSSLMLECAVNALGIERAVKKTRALVADETLPLSPLFHSILGKSYLSH